MARLSAKMIFIANYPEGCIIAPSEEVKGGESYGKDTVS